MFFMTARAVGLCFVVNKKPILTTSKVASFAFLFTPRLNLTSLCDLKFSYFLLKIAFYANRL
ncbi:hypothetical protein [Campylobacter mucosalis]|uniref:hypothetical protein n=1 Tax=Campylobacter mucosalis TaxID=202 RepID=UPI001555A515|nr:hypothetical protein [Campylobacter mucosalis]